MPRVSTQEDGRGTGCLLFFFFFGGMKSYPILRYGDSMGIIYIIYPLLGCPGVLEVRILMVNGSIGLVITYLQMEYFGVT